MPVVQCPIENCEYQTPDVDPVVAAALIVARVTLHNMKQDRGEPIRAYGARLRGQAGVCKFTQQCDNCNADVDYTEAILRDVLCQGLEDSEIQLDLLGDKNQDMTLEQIL